MSRKLDMMEALQALAADRGISSETLMGALADAMEMAYMKMPDHREYAWVTIDPDTFDIRVLSQDLDEDGETQLPEIERDDVTELEEVITPVLGLLWVKEGPRRGKYYPIKHGTVVGRKDGCDLRMDDQKVSSMHAKFNIEDDEFVVWDLGSANGTYVNGKRIREATVLDENDLAKDVDEIQAAFSH